MTWPDPPLVLASESPRRKRLLEQAGIAFIVCPSGVDETVPPDWTPEQTALELARRKAEVVYQRCVQQQTNFSAVLAADTVVAWQQQMFGKPLDNADAYRMVYHLSHHPHRVITGVCLWVKDQSPLLQADTSHITMRPMSHQDITRYVESGQSAGKAGAIDIEAIQPYWVEKIIGAFDNVVGLPIEVVKSLLQKGGVYGQVNRAADRSCQF